jgi:hypothetical protein
MALKKGKYYHKFVEFEITDSTTLTDLNWVLVKHPELKEIVSDNNNVKRGHNYKSKAKPK